MFDLPRIPPPLGGGGFVGVASIARCCSFPALLLLAVERMEKLLCSASIKCTLLELLDTCPLSPLLLFPVATVAVPVLLTLLLVLLEKDELESNSGCCFCEKDPVREAFSSASEERCMWRCLPERDEE
jgi:hypothetical protein